MNVIISLEFKKYIAFNLVPQTKYFNLVTYINIADDLF